MSAYAVAQASIRHNLSLNKIFRRVHKPITEPGKGGYWTVDSTAGEGNKRERKRKRAGKAQQAATANADQPSASQVAEDVSSDEERGIQSASVGMSHGHGQFPGSYFGGSTYEEPTIDPALLNQGHFSGHDQTQSRSERLVPAPYAHPAFPVPTPASGATDPRAAAPGQMGVRPGQVTPYGYQTLGQDPLARGFDAWEASFMAGPPMWGTQASAPPNAPGVGHSGSVPAPAMRGQPARSMTAASAPAQMGATSVYPIPTSSVYHPGSVTGSVGTAGSSSSSTSETGSTRSAAGVNPQVYRRGTGSSSGSSSHSRA